MNTIDEQIEYAKKLLASLEAQKAAADAAAIAKTEEAAKLPKAWIPKIGQGYYSILSNGEIESCNWYADDTEVGRRPIGNIYKTREAAEFEIERRKVETELRRYIYEHGGGNGEFVVNSSNYYLCYNHQTRILGTFSASYARTADIFCNDRDLMRDAIKSIGEERIKKYYLRVKE